MLTRPISFCGRVAFNIIDTDFKARTLRDLDERFGCGVVRRHYDRFDPALSPARLTRAPHAVCLRSNGNPYFLFLTRCGRKSLAIFVDKKVQSGYAQPRMIVAPFQMRSGAFNDNVLEGEMVRDASGGWVFLVNDAPGLDGRRSTEPFECRLRRLTGLLEDAYTPSSIDVCDFQVKRFVPASEAGELVHGLAPSLPYTSRGLLFKPLRGSALDVLFNFDDTIVRTPAVRAKVCKDRVFATLAELEEQPSVEKKKMKKEPTVAVEEAPKVQRELRVVRGNGPDTYHVVGDSAAGAPMFLRVVTLAQSRAMRSLFMGVPPARPVAVTCVWDPTFRRWTPTSS